MAASKPDAVWWFTVESEISYRGTTIELQTAPGVKYRVREIKHGHPVEIRVIMTAEGDSARSKARKEYARAVGMTNVQEWD